MTCIVESHTGNKGKVNLVILIQWEVLTNGFEDVESTFTKTIFTLKVFKHQIIANYHWQKELFPLQKSFIKQGLQVWFIGQSMIKQNGLCLFPAGHLHYYLA